ncbi:DNA-processing protein DprA [Pseudomonas nitroreducens]|uniref:DNA-processing protein DprA n=1 Tax=Pseudomonas nitroreducens TaxID=46680 RepID=UPI002658DD53|nr:DNA-processing protein DprA [Pseudomonas nitroreducens]MCP1649435.1 DNA processing protein [Pseudomonas nitroreducens]MCP1684604.1 DNA processing protein [Pseudomonas nitroreducens]
MSMTSPATIKLLALSMLAGIGPATLRKIASLNAFELASVESLGTRVPALARALSAPLAWSVAVELAEKQIDAAAANQARIISALDAEYPALLKLTKDDPFILFVKGSLSSTPERSVAIIGTRQPTKHGELIARRITEFFAEQRWSVVSGLALGCDALAHKAALAVNGHTVAVLAHGLQTVAPSQHRKLAEEILDAGGALVSEYRFGQGALPMQFVKRDRTQAGLAQGVVMIQSDLKGGSLHASRAALDYDRWLAVPFPTEADRSANEPKIQANLFIAGNSADYERANFLKCHVNRLSKVIVLRTKDDYPRMVSAVLADEVSPGVSAESGNEPLSENNPKFATSVDASLEEKDSKKDITEAPASPNVSIESELISDSQPDNPPIEPGKDKPLTCSNIVENGPNSPKSKRKKAKDKAEGKTGSEGEITIQHPLL